MTEKKEVTEVYICGAIRTPVGRYGGGLAPVRADDLAALPIRVLMERHPDLDPAAIDDVILGCANQSGEDNRNVARMALLLAGLPASVPGVTVNRLCSSGLNAIAAAANAIQAGEGELMIAGGVESMSRAPFVIGKAGAPFDRAPKMEDTTMGWRFVNPRLDAMYGTETMPKTAENLAGEYGISREDQDAFALWSQQKAAAAQADGSLAGEIVPVEVPRRKQDPLIVDTDEHPRQTSLEKLAALRPLFPDGTITAGNASPLARIVGTAYAGVPPRTMGYGPVPATQKLLLRLGLGLDEFDLIELNEAFAAQALTCLRELGLADDDPRVNPRGGAIALGHPLGMSGARLAVSAVDQLVKGGGKRALCTMCVGVGQGIATVLERA